MWVSHSPCLPARQTEKEKKPDGENMSWLLLLKTTAAVWEELASGGIICPVDDAWTLFLLGPVKINESIRISRPQMLRATKHGQKFHV